MIETPVVAQEQEKLTSSSEIQEDQVDNQAQKDDIEPEAILDSSPKIFDQNCPVTSTNDTRVSGNKNQKRPLKAKLQETNQDLLQLHSTQFDLNDETNSDLPDFQLSAIDSVDCEQERVHPHQVSTKNNKPSAKRRRLFNPNLTPQEEEHKLSPVMNKVHSQDRVFVPPPSSAVFTQSNSSGVSVPKRPTTRKGRAKGKQVTKKKTLTKGMKSMLPPPSPSQSGTDLAMPVPSQKQLSEPTQSQLVNKSYSKYQRIFACSKLSLGEYEALKSLCKNLEGRSKIDAQVTKYTTHIIVHKPYLKTEKVLLGIIFGTWIIDASYITDSLAANHWLPEESYELKSFLPAIGVTRFERHLIGKTYRLQIFKGIHLFIDPDIKAGKEIIKNFVTLMGGVVVENVKLATYVIADTILEGKIPTLASVWVTDSLCAGSLKSIKPYDHKLLSQSSNRSRRSRSRSEISLI